MTPKLPPVELQPPTVSLETKCFQKYLRPYVSIPIQLILSRDLDTDRLFQSNGHQRTLQGSQLATLEADPRASYLTHLNWNSSFQCLRKQDFWVIYHPLYYYAMRFQAENTCLPLPQEICHKRKHGFSLICEFKMGSVKCTDKLRIVCMCVYLYVNVCTLCVHVYTCIRLCVYVSMKVCMYICVHIICMCMCVHMCICILQIVHPLTEIPYVAPGWIFGLRTLQYHRSSTEPGFIFAG